MAAFTGVVLAGGRSTRMGADKAGLRWRGQPMLDCMQALLRQAGAQRVLVSGPYPEPPGLPDRHPGLGPLGGLVTLAQTQPDGLYLLVPVDMPLLTAALLAPLVLAVESATASCASYAGHVLPLCLRLDAATRAAIEATGQLPRSLRSLRTLRSTLGGLERELGGGDQRCLVNCNTPDEWREVAP